MTERLRVLRIIARMNVGGPALQVSGLLRGMNAERFDHRVLTGEVEPDEADYLALRAPDLSVERVDGLGRSVAAGADLRALWALCKHIRAFRPHIVHTHTAKAGVLGRVAARTCGVPGVVHTFHGHLLHGYFPPTTTRVVVQAERLLARTSTRLVAVGAQVRDDLLAAGIGRSAQYLVVPPGLALPPAPERSAARSLLGLPATGPVVTLVARLTAVKRPERFIALAQALAGRHPDATFVICGEGELMPLMQEQAGVLGDRVRFLGWRGDVETVYAATDVVVLTSDNEGMPVSLIEAALSGVAAVATRVGSVAEVVEHERTGLLVEPSTSAIIGAVDRLICDGSLRRSLATEATSTAAARFGRARLVNDIEQLYEGIARDKRLAGR